MDKRTKGRTSFIIAHRLSTGRNADLILVLNHGDIVEQGTHEELRAADGFYAKLYNSRFEKDFLPMPTDDIRTRYPALYACFSDTERGNTPVTLETLAALWRGLPRDEETDRRLRRWFKDYYLTRNVAEAFELLIRRLELTALYNNRYPLPDTPAHVRLLMRFSDFDFARNAFSYRPTKDGANFLETAFALALRSLRPHCLELGVDFDRTLLPPPRLFVYYAPFEGLDVMPPPETGPRTVRIGLTESYVLKNGLWSFGGGDARRPSSSPAMGLMLLTLEQTFRNLQGISLRTPKTDALFSRWMSSPNFDRRLLPLLYDNVFSTLLAEAAETVWRKGGEINTATLLPSAAKIQEKMTREPWLRIKKLRALGDAPLETQLRILADADDMSEAEITAVLGAEPTSLSTLDTAQIFSFMAWRIRYNKGEDAFGNGCFGYALLYWVQLENGIGTNDPFADMCALLRRSRDADKRYEKELPPRLRAWHEKNFGGADFYLAAQRHGVIGSFPAAVCAWEDENELLRAYNSISLYKICAAPLYKTAPRTFLENLLRAAHRAASAWLKEKNIILSQIFVQDEETPHTGAPFLAASILKQMDTQVRRQIRLYGGTGKDATGYLTHLTNPNCGYAPAIRNALTDPAFRQKIDDAINTALRLTDLSAILGKSKERHTKKKFEAAAVADSSHEMTEPIQYVVPVAPDPARLRIIRAETDETQNALHVATEDETTHTASAPRKEDWSAEAFFRDAQPGSSAEENWAEFWRLCDEREKEILRRLAHNEPTAQGNALFFEALNEKALDTLGDLITDGDMLLEEYRQKILAEA
jgi:hypothetical protein